MIRLLIVLVVIASAATSLAQIDIAFQPPSNTVLGHYDDHMAAGTEINFLYNRQSETHCSADWLEFGYAESVVLVCVYEHPLDDYRLLHVFAGEAYADASIVVILRDDDIIEFFTQFEESPRNRAVQLWRILPGPGVYEVFVERGRDNEIDRAAARFVIEPDE